MEPFRSQKRQRPFYFYPVDAIIFPNIFKHFPWISPHPMASVWWHAWELMSLHAHMHLCFRLNSRRWEFLCVSSSFMCSLRVRLFISQVFTLAYSKGFRPFLELTELVRSCLWNTRKRQNLLQGYGERRGNGKPFAALWRITLKHKTLSLMPVLWNLLWTSYFFFSSHNRFNMTLFCGVLEFSRTCYYIIGAFKDNQCMKSTHACVVSCFKICNLVKGEIQRSCFALDLDGSVLWFIQILFKHLRW